MLAACVGLIDDKCSGIETFPFGFMLKAVMSTPNHTIPFAESTCERLLTSCRQQLEAERIRLNAEIGAYPSPIPACDAQFNHLLDKRTRLATALTLFDQLLEGGHALRIDVKAFEELIAAIHQFDAGMAEKITAGFTIATAS